MASPRRRRASAGRRPLDQRTAAEAFAYPGIDPRMWITFALVDQDEPIDFDPEYGPLISCTAEPGGNPLRCQLSMQVAGDGEGEYHPFVAGDTVLVLCVGGNERTAVIVGRMPNARAPFPPNVGGQDATKNAFGFVRRRTPFVQEQVGPWMVRDAKSEAFLAIDIKGNVTLRDGSKGALQLSPDAFGYQSGDGKSLLQLDLTGGRFTMQIQDAQIVLASSSASPQTSVINVPGQLSVITGATTAAEHVLTVEGMLNILQAWSLLLAAAIPTVLLPAIVTPAVGAPLGPLIGVPLATLFASPLGTAMIAAAVGVASGQTLDPGIATAIGGALAVPKNPSTGKYGTGCANFVAG